RHGKPVEISALWLNALARMVAWAERFRDDPLAMHCRSLRDKGAKSFNEKFWYPEANCLFDVIESEAPGDRDASLRPNQILAVSLPNTPLAPERFAPVLGAVEKSLAAPFGLRSLSPDDPGYFGAYGGDRRQRDAQYHNGPVWGWLLGPYV